MHQRYIFLFSRDREHYSVICPCGISQLVCTVKKLTYLPLDSFLTQATNAASKCHTSQRNKQIITHHGTIDAAGQSIFTTIG